MVRLAKIVVTLGPACYDRIDELLLAGANVFRINLSHEHDDNSEHIERIKQIREAAVRLGKSVAIMADLQGPDFRLGDLEDHEPIVVSAGQVIHLAVGSTPGNKRVLYTPNSEAALRSVDAGQRVLLDDGAVRLRTTKRISDTEVECVVDVGGKVGEKKEINFPETVVTSWVPKMAEKNVLFAIRQGLDYFVVSFVQEPQNIIDLRQYCEAHAEESGAPKVVLAKTEGPDARKSWAGTLPLLIAKIEKPVAVENAQAILAVSDGLMIARGDLGVEMTLERVPGVQKMLIEMCNEAQKPVITATQMLQSMIHSPVPTRAEVSDVANAVFDGSDAVMLVAETATGEYPVQSVATQARVVEEAERTMSAHFSLSPTALHELTDMFSRAVHTSDEELPFRVTIAKAAVDAARKSKAKAIIAISNSGQMALRIAKFKPLVPVIAITHEKHACHRMALFGGVHPLVIPMFDTAEETLAAIDAIVKENGFLEGGEQVIFCASSSNVPTLANTIKFVKFGEFSK